MGHLQVTKKYSLYEFHKNIKKMKYNYIHNIGSKYITLLGTTLCSAHIRSVKRKPLFSSAEVMTTGYLTVFCTFKIMRTVATFQWNHFQYSLLLNRLLLLRSWTNRRSEKNKYPISVVSSSVIGIWLPPVRGGGMADGHTDIETYRLN